MNAGKSTTGTGRASGRRLLGLTAAAGLLAVGAAVPANAAGHTGLVAQLRGASEVPGPGDADGSGRAAVMLRPGAGKICAKIMVSDIGTPLAAHIHDGDRTVAGPVVVDLSGSVTGGARCVDVPRDLIRDIAMHPGQYYVNVHNAEFPGGAVRGQLRRSVSS